MSERLSPGPEAKARIQALSEKDFHAFFDEVPVGAMQRVARFLPSIDGFRQTSAAGITRQKAALARKLNKPNATDREFHGLYLIWRSWIDENLENAVTVQELIDHVEDAAAEAQSSENRRLAIEGKVDSLFAKLNEESRLNRCTREQIERLFTFSPLPETSATRSMIASAKAGSEVERDAKWDELPNRLQQDEDEINRLKADVKNLSDRLDPAARSIAQALTAIGELRSGIAQAKQEIAGVRTESQRHAAGHGRFVDAATAKEKAADARLKSLSEQVEMIAKDLQTLRAAIPNTDQLDRKVDQLSAAMAGVTDRERATQDKIGNLESEMQRLSRHVAALNDDHTINDRLVSLMARIAGLEEHATSLIDTNHMAASQAPDLRASRAARRWEPLSVASEATPAPIETHAEIAANFSVALQSVGLRKTAADIFGEECAAAIMARQAVFLKGSFATDVARGLARSIGGPLAVRLAVPIGLEDDEQLRASIDEMFGKDRPYVGALVIEGVNLSPIQITRDAIADCLIGGVPPIQQRISVFATISEGVASLPLEKSYLELGPVFDLDVLDWRTAYSGDRATPPRTLSIERDRSLFDPLEKDNSDTGEATRLVRLFTNRRDPSIERSFVRAFRALQFIRKSSSEVTPLQSLFYGWLLPYWRIGQVAGDQVDSELDGGKVNGSKIDQRLAAIFDADFRGSGKES
jgi:hypothetical protein